jgi:hypothetical protein
MGPADCPRLGDEAFKQRLLSAPQAVLKEHGFELEAGSQLTVKVESTDKLHYLVHIRAHDRAIVPPADAPA